jgi:hypothetical protein
VVGYYLDSTVLVQRDGDRDIRPAVASVIEGWAETPGVLGGRWKLCWRDVISDSTNVILRVTGPPALHRELVVRCVLLGSTLQEAINRLGDRTLTRGARLVDQVDDWGDRV